jgi:hypothetical protein
LDPHGGGAKHLFPPANYQDAVFSPDGKRLVMCGFDTATVWDRVEGRTRGRLLPFSAVKGCRALHFTPDGRRIIVGESEGLSLWDADTCRKLCRETVPAKAVVASAFTNSGQLVVADDTGRLFVLKTVPDTLSTPAEQCAALPMDWRPTAQASALPPAAEGGLVVCFAGVSADRVPGTAGAHCEELGVWRSSRAHAFLLASPRIPGESELAATDILRLCGQGATAVAPAALQRLRAWVEHGGKLFITGTGSVASQILRELGLPSPGKPERIRVPPGMPGALPIWTPTGHFRLFGVTQVQKFPSVSEPPSPVLAQTVGKGVVLAVLGDSWCDDVPRDGDSRACLSLGDNRSILQDCIRFLTQHGAAGERNEARSAR